jgi:hypothetical protein
MKKKKKKRNGNLQMRHGCIGIGKACDNINMQEILKAIRGNICTELRDRTRNCYGKCDYSLVINGKKSDCLQTCRKVLGSYFVEHGKA